MALTLACAQDCLKGLLRYFGVLAPNAAIREQVIQSAGPSPALLEKLKNAADLMGIKEEGEKKDTVEVTAGTKALASLVSAARHWERRCARCHRIEIQKLHVSTFDCIELR